MYILKAFSLGEIKGDDCSNCASIISVSDGSESLLACGVPYLIFYAFTIDVHGLCCELNSNGGLGVHIKDVVDKSGEQIGFANPRVSDHYDFEEEVKFLLSGHSINLYIRWIL